MKHYDVTGIGNALVDVLSPAEDAALQKLSLAKGSFDLVDAAAAETIYLQMKTTELVPGGAAANTIFDVVNMGGTGCFIGKVAQDQFGDVFVHDMTSNGISYPVARLDPALAQTGCVYILITPDGERTMRAHLGAAGYVSRADLDEKILSDSKIVFLEGYIWSTDDKDEANALVHEAAMITKKAGGKIAFSVATALYADMYRDIFMNYIRDHADIVVANDEEIITLYQTETFDEAIAMARQAGKIMALTRGEKGAVLVSAQGEIHEISAEKVAKVVDATGAGDAFAAGFFLGLAQGKDLPIAGKMGAIAAAEIITHIGARPLENLQTRLKQKIA